MIVNNSVRGVFYKTHRLITYNSWELTRIHDTKTRSCIYICKNTFNKIIEKLNQDKYFRQKLIWERIEMVKIIFANL